MVQDHQHLWDERLEFLMRSMMNLVSIDMSLGGNGRAGGASKNGGTIGVRGLRELLLGCSLVTTRSVNIP
jgi:hypothetical protein